MTVSATDYTAVFGSATDTAYASGSVSIPTTGSAPFSAAAGVSASGSAYAYDTACVPPPPTPSRRVSMICTPTPRRSPALHTPTANASRRYLLLSPPPLPVRHPPPGLGPCCVDLVVLGTGVLACRDGRVRPSSVGLVSRSKRGHIGDPVHPPAETRVFHTACHQPCLTLPHASVPPSQPSSFAMCPDALHPAPLRRVSLSRTVSRLARWLRCALLSSTTTVPAPKFGKRGEGMGYRALS